MNAVKTILPGQYLPMHNRESTDFPWQKPQQLPSAEVDVEG